MKKLAIFDLDGTLIDSLTCIKNICNKALEENGLKPRTLDEYRYFAGDGALELVKRAINQDGNENLDNLDNVYNSYKLLFELDCTKDIYLFEDIEYVLDKLKEKGVKIAVLTNKPHDRTMQVVEKLFKNDIFDYILGYKNEETKKPNPYGALFIAKELGIDIKDCLYIGDTDTDIKTGKNANMYTVGVTWGFRDKKELEENKADIIIEKPKQILDIFNM